MSNSIDITDPEVWDKYVNSAGYIKYNIVRKGEADSFCEAIFRVEHAESGYIYTTPILDEGLLLKSVIVNERATATLSPR